MNKRVEDIVNLLDGKKAENVEVIDLSENDYFVDYVIVATSLNDKHGFALLNYLKEDLKPKGEEFLNVDESDEWIVVDLGDILIHLMLQSTRDRFNIEEFLESLKKNKID